MLWCNRLAVAVLVLCMPLGAGAAVLDRRALPFDEPVRQFYAARDWNLAWSGSAAAEADARQAISILSKAGTEGLDASRYIWAARGNDPSFSDVAITGAVLNYMNDLAFGRSELRAVDADVGLSSRSGDFAGQLEAALKSHRVAQMLAELAPKHAEYLALKAALPTAGERAPTIVANMERWRWLPSQFEDDRIMVNAANAELDLWLNGKPILHSRVVVGRPATRTPILRAEGAGITFNPFWTIPKSIAAKEILPKLKKNPAWLASHDMLLLDGPKDDPQGLRINWRAVRTGTFPYQIRQNPGPRNPLGRIKLELPNRFDVYLHDTSNKGDFQKPKRQLSHGCVRVEKILSLATHILGADIAATRKIAEALGQRDSSYLVLPRRVPIYLLYWTAIPHDGAVTFLEDSYGRDRRLIAAMHATSIRLAGAETPCVRG